MKKGRFNKLNIIGFTSILISAIFILFIIKLNILPTKYLIFLLGVVILINIVAMIFINIKKKVFKILGIIIFVISILISMIGSYYLYYSVDFLNKSFNVSDNVYTSKFYIITYRDNNISNKKKVTGNVSYYINTTNIDKAINKLKKTNEINTTTYEDISPMFSDLAIKTIKYVVIDESTYNVLFDLDNTLNKDNYKVIAEISIVLKKDNTPKEVKESFNLYIGGNDFTNSLMDFNMIVTVNTKTNKVLLTSIPRDYYIEEYGTAGKKDTLSYMGANGIEVNKKSLENLFDINIDYYMKINTHSLVNVVDSVGGITFCSEQSFKTTHSTILDSYDDSKGRKLYIKSGCQELNGIETLTVARERKNIVGGDVARQKNCQKIFVAIIDKLKTTNTITNYNSILNSFSSLYETTMPRDVVTNIIKQLINGKSYQISDQIVEGDAGKDFVHLTNYKDWVMYPNMDSVNNAKLNIDKILNDY